VPRRPFPKEHQAFDIGSYAGDWRRIERELGWRPRTVFADGIRQTLEYYRREGPHYVKDLAPGA
jgi:dTDP-D-glucose 4,6-dehydratase